MKSTKTFLMGLALGTILASLAPVLAGNFYDRYGNTAAPSGSQQQMDYFRQRQQMLDIQKLRQLEERKAAERANRLEPCAR